MKRWEERSERRVREECGGNFREIVKRKGMNISRELVQRSGFANLCCDGDTL
jgi:hypothetical protein